jgi:Kdo2-lipid IVA lauroyltransferase/acyltransferase
MGSKLLYYLIIIPISALPYGLIYLFSNFIFFILFRVLNYRSNVIENNLKKSFPNKNNQEINLLKREFYKHFADIIIESLKGFTISKKNISLRLTVQNQELVDHYYTLNKNIILVGGHYNNWEICGQCSPIHCKHDLIAIYKPLSNKFFDKKMRDSREKFGLSMVPMKQAKRYFTSNNTTPFGIIFGSDQSPSNPKKAYWTNFLNQDTGVLFGAEKYSKEFDWPVIYVGITKVKRGHYTVNYQLVSENPNQEKHGSITEKFTNLLEKDILNAPQFYLWTHRRWKHKKP